MSSLSVPSTPWMSPRLNAAYASCTILVFWASAMFASVGSSYLREGRIVAQPFELPAEAAVLKERLSGHGTRNRDDLRSRGRILHLQSRCESTTIRRDEQRVA